MKQVVLIIALFACIACSKENEEKETVVTSPATLEYLIEPLYWLYEYPNGKPQNETQQGYTFQRMFNELKGTKYTDAFKRVGKNFTFTFNAPKVELTYEDGTKETLTVYKIKKGDSNQNYLQINGATYCGYWNGLSVY